MAPLALCIGSAACLWRDLAALKKLVDLDTMTTFAANDGMVLWPGRLDHVATIHPEELPGREKQRERKGYPGGYVTWGTTGKVDKVLPRDWQLDGGSSGLMAAAVAAHLGHQRIILCGIPLDGQGYAMTHQHHGDGAWPYYSVYQDAVPSLAKRHRWMEKRIRSMSGWSAEFFGRPEDL